MSPARSSSATEISFCRRAISASSSERTVASSFTVQGFSFSRTRRRNGCSRAPVDRPDPPAPGPSVLLAARVAPARAAGLVAVAPDEVALDEVALDTDLVEATFLVVAFVALVVPVLPAGLVATVGVAALVAATLVAATLVGRAAVADLVVATFVVLALAAVAFAARSLAAVSGAVPFSALVFVVAFRATALAGAAFFDGTPLLAAEVAFFTAMLGPLHNGIFDVPTKHVRVCVRIGPSGPVLNGETPPRARLVPPIPPRYRSPQPGPEPERGANHRGRRPAGLILAALSVEQLCYL